MLREAVRAVLVRELRALRRAVETYPDDASLWALPAGVPNAAGTLVLHMAGNLQHFVGAVLGETGYRRERDAEFSRRDMTRAELLAEIDAAIAAVELTLEQLSDDAVHEPYPEEIGGRRIETSDWLVHLVAHTAITSVRSITTGGW
ncbi:MAG TPA: DinB family protein [Gemmatimonadaceae bacterium]|nr:DinB family protein [Gemmatimonadaceae bacterium]